MANILTNIERGNIWISMDTADDCLDSALAMWDQYITGEVQREYEEQKVFELAEGRKIGDFSENCISPLEHLELILDDLNCAASYIKKVSSILKKLHKAQKKCP